MKEEFSKLKAKLARLDAKREELDRRDEAGTQTGDKPEAAFLAEHAERSEARAEIFVEYAKVYVELAALAKAFAALLRASMPEAGAQPAKVFNS